MKNNKNKLAAFAHQAFFRSLASSGMTKESLKACGIGVLVAFALVIVASFSSLDSGQRSEDQSDTPADFSAEDPESPVKVYTGDGVVVG